MGKVGASKFFPEAGHGVARIGVVTKLEEHVCDRLAASAEGIFESVVEIAAEQSSLRGQVALFWQEIDEPKPVHFPSLDCSCVVELLFEIVVLLLHVNVEAVFEITVEHCLQNTVLVATRTKHSKFMVLVFIDDLENRVITNVGVNLCNIFHRDKGSGAQNSVVVLPDFLDDGVEVNCRANFLRNVCTPAFPS